MASLKTRSGVELTEELIEKLADRAEAGFDPATFRPQRGGRPSLGEGTSPRVQFRVDPATFEALLARARAEDRGVSEIARIALEQYLYGAGGGDVGQVTEPGQAEVASRPVAVGVADS